MFKVHHMFLNVFAFNRSECADADMQRYKTDFDAMIAYTF